MTVFFLKRFVHYALMGQKSFCTKIFPYIFDINGCFLFFFVKSFFTRFSRNFQHEKQKYIQFILLIMFMIVLFTLFLKSVKISFKQEFVFLCFVFFTKYYYIILEICDMENLCLNYNCL
jgi:hypothetical protein